MFTRVGYNKHSFYYAGGAEGSRGVSLPGWPQQLARGVLSYWRGVVLRFVAANSGQGVQKYRRVPTGLWQTLCRVSYCTG